MRMKMLLGLLAALAASVSSWPSAADGATNELGAPLAQSTFVGAMAAGPDGNVWFSARNYRGLNARVVGKVTPGGEVAEYSVPDGANSITTGADGNVWFTEAGGIGRITPGGDATSFKLVEGTGAPRGLAAGPDGNVWFVTAEPAAVGRILPSGSVTMFPLSGEGQPSAITPGPGGDLWFAEPEAGRIGRITVAGEEGEFLLPKGARPNSVVLGPDGNLWFSDNSQPRVGRITPAGEVTFFPVPTLDSTDEVVVGPGGLIWFTANDEIGAITTAGKVSWPSCLSRYCEYPPAAMTMGSDGHLWVASGVGSCPSYCGGGTGQSYLLFGSSSIGPFAKPSVTVGIGPRLAPLRQGKTSIVVGCGEGGACRGTLRLRALVKPPGNRFFARRISRVRYFLAAGEIQKVTLRFPLSRWNKLRYSRGFLIIDALQGGLRVAKRGFYFSPKKGGTAKQVQPRTSYDPDSRGCLDVRDRGASDPVGIVVGTLAVLSPVGDRAGVSLEFPDACSCLCIAAIFERRVARRLLPFEPKVAEEGPSSAETRSLEPVADDVLARRPGGPDQAGPLVSPLSRKVDVAVQRHVLEGEGSL